MHTLLVLNVSPEFEEELVDCLLEAPEVSGFTTFQVYGHGEGGRMTLAEQVRGRRKRLQVEIVIEAQKVNRILSLVAESVGCDGVYWEQPVRNLGRLEQLSTEQS
jgi:nitrogen regulatory protein PII